MNGDENEKDDGSLHDIFELKEERVDSSNDNSDRLHCSNRKLFEESLVGDSMELKKL